MIKFLFLLSTPFIYGQLLHHQSISAQGSLIKLNSGLRVSQTIGQQSNIGTATNPVVVQQGFQQSLFSLLNSKTTIKIDNIKVFPNPFKSVIHLNFENNTTKSISIYDLTGALILNRSLQF